MASRTSAISLTRTMVALRRRPVGRLSLTRLRPIPARMDDSFSLGEPAKRRARPVKTAKHAAPRARRSPAGGLERTRYILGGIGLVVAAFLVWGFMHFMSSAGNQAANGEAAEIGAAQDVQAQTTGEQAIQTVEGLATTGSFGQITPEAMKRDEPTYSYTAGPSTGPNNVSVAGTADGVGIAVLSTSGHCLYAHVSASGVTYGTGTTCTGVVALKASAPAWPNPA